MRTITSTGHEANPPTLAISGGQGNSRNPEVHLILREADGENTRSIMAWFSKAELLAAIEAATPKRITEPVAAE